MPTPVYVSFIGEINPTTCEVLVGTIAQQIKQHESDEIHLLMSTPGGNVREGIAVYNLLKALPSKLITYNVGQVNSIGNVIFLAGDERYAAVTSSFMFHGVGFDISNSRFEEKQLVERLESLKNDQSLMGEIIAQRTNIDAEEVNGLFLQAAFIRADDAKNKWIIDDVRDVNVPQGAPFVQLVFKR